MPDSTTSNSFYYLWGVLRMNRSKKWKSKAVNEAMAHLAETLGIDWPED